MAAKVLPVRCSQSRGGDALPCNGAAASEHRAAEGGPSCTDSPSAACGCCLAWPPAPAKAVRSSALGAVHSDALSEPGQAPQSPDAPDAADLAAAEGAAAVYSALTLNVPAAPPPLAPADTKRRRKPEAPQLPLDLQLEILRVLGAAWDARADAPCAADELREWAQYCGVSRSWRAYFGGRPLRLAFDAPLTKAQSRWLQTTRVPIRRITFQWVDRAPVAVHGSIDG